MKHLFLTGGRLVVSQSGQNKDLTMSQQPDRNLLPIAVLLAQMLFIGVWLGATGRFQPVVVRDTAGYADFQWQSPEAVLSQLRTPGYPAFLTLNGLIADDFCSVPIIQFLTYTAAVVVFFWGVRQFTSSSAIACAAASTLLYSRILHGHVDVVATETFAASAGISVCGLTLWRLAAPGPIITACLVLTAATGWLVRPAYIFLVPLVPILTWLLGSATLTTERRSRWLHVLSALALTAVPLCGYSLLRYCVVGRMGIVSFGGYNQIGISGQFLDSAGLDQLPGELRGTAAAALEIRSSAQQPPGEYDDLARLNYMRLEDRYDTTIWHEFVPAAEQAVGHDPVQVNTQLRRLATALIRVYPRSYAVWLAKASRQAAKKVLWDFADNPVTLGLLFLTLVRICQPRFLLNYYSSASASVERTGLRSLLILAGTYLVLSLAVVIPLCPPLGRFTDAASVMLACPLAAWLITDWTSSVNSVRST